MRTWQASCRRALSSPLSSPPILPLSPLPTLPTLPLPKLSDQKRDTERVDPVTPCSCNCSDGLLPSYFLSLVLTLLRTVYTTTRPSQWQSHRANNLFDKIYLSFNSTIKLKCISTRQVLLSCILNYRFQKWFQYCPEDFNKSHTDILIYVYIIQTYLWKYSYIFTHADMYIDT